MNRVLQNVGAIPGVEATAISTRAPLDSSTPVLRVSAAAAVAQGTEAPSVSFLVVSPEYFNVVKTPIVAGRAFTDRDDATGVVAAIVNETLASRLWPAVTRLAVGYGSIRRCRRRRRPWSGSRARAST